MRVLSVCEYLMDGDRKPDHFTPYQIVQAVKGRSFKGFSWLVVGGHRQLLDEHNLPVAVAWAAQKLSEQIFDEFEDDAVTIVPIPGHTHVTAEEVAAGRVHHLGSVIAEALRQRVMDAEAAPLLCWETPMQSAREGGSRDAQFLKEHLQVIGSPGNRKIILLDDVVTSGGHISAAHAAVTEAGFDVADVAFAVARTVYAKDEALGTRVEDCPRPMLDFSLVLDI